MNTNAIGLAIFLGTISLGFLLYGSFVRTGKIRSWWLLQSNPLVPEATNYIAIPFSICLLVLAVGLLLPTLESRRQFLDYAGILLIISVILGMWRPRWLTPSWILWMEDNHRDILSLLREDARKTGPREWSKQVRTQEGLEEWVTKVRHKYGRLYDREWQIVLQNPDLTSRIHSETDLRRAISENPELFGYSSQSSSERK